MSDSFETDRRALKLLLADVARLANEDLGRPTPCDGWDVAALLHHMNAEHAAICGSELDEAADPRAEFARIVGEWLAFFEREPTTVLVPKMSTTLPTDMVLATHAADMLVHRWDLAAALGEAAPTPADLLAIAHGVADFVTAPGSSLVGPGGVYKAAVGPVPGDLSLETLVRKFGRDPHWRPSA